MPTNGNQTKPGGTNVDPMPGDKSASNTSSATTASAPMSGADTAKAGGTAGTVSTHPAIAPHQDETGKTGEKAGKTERLKAKVPDDVKRQANSLLSDASGKARNAAVEGKARASQTVSGLAQSTRDAARQFEGTQAAALTGYITSAADTIDHFAATLDSKEIDELLGDVREMVRRSPAIAIGAAAMAGFALSRFLKATDRFDDDLNDDRTASGNRSASEL